MDNNTGGSRATPRGAAGRRIAAERRALGIGGEEAVTHWYVERGWEVLDRNWRVRAGEIDIVAWRDGVVVFCEVKTRSSNRFGHPAETMGYERRRRFRRLVGQWLTEHEVRPRGIRTDLAAVTPDGIEVIEGAFDLW